METLVDGHKNLDEARGAARRNADTAPLSPLIRFYFWLGRRDSSVRILQGTACQGWKITIARELSEIRRPGSASATPLGLGK
jgi:hypothetical protein